MANIVVAGGGICGLAAASVLADDGHRVTVLERDPAPPPPDPDAASRWQRRSIAQFVLAHWLHARGRQLLATHVPSALALLHEHGGYRFNAVDFLLSMQPGAERQPDDDRFDVVTGRRSTLEWALATAAERHPAVTVRRGEALAGFTVGQPVAAGVPHVTGVRLASGEEVLGDLVVDATGRRSATPEWLAAIGARPPEEDAEDSGFAYYGRYFRSADGSVPAMLSPGLTPFGTFSMLTLPADNGTWSVTLYGLAEDKPLRRFRDPEAFARVVRACPVHAHWLDGEPITDMASMAGVVDRHRRFVVDGVPCATGVLTVADAASCTNPSLGRGITLGLLHVEVLREAVAAHLDDPVALSLAFDEATEGRVRPWHDATTAVDRERVREMRALVAGEPFEPSPRAQVGRALEALAPTDPTLARAYASILGCLTLPEEEFAEPGLLDRVLSLAAASPPRTAPGPSREELLTLLA